MANKKYQIFISSTYTDLVEERKAVQEVILKMYQIPIGMEMFSADNEEQWEVIQETIDSSDYYVLIIGRRYGSTTEEGISYTEKEYQYAKSNDIPILAFIIGDKAPLTVDKMENDKEKVDSLERFIHDAQTGRMVEWWNSKEELAMKVALALQKQISRGKRPGWIRSDVINVEATQNELVEMSKKIRNLEEENEVLRGRINERKPEFNVSINRSKFIKLESKQYDTSFVYKEYKKMTMSDVPSEFKSDISQREIDEYNDSLPNNIELEQYIKRWLKYKQLKENNIKLNIEVNNLGNIKANNIYVDLEFPKEIAIDSTKIVNNFNEPKKPNKKENPVDIIKRRNSLLGIGGTYASHYSESPYLVPIHSYDRTTSEDSYSLEGNKLHIWRRELLHTKVFSLNNMFCIAGLERGEYDIRYSIICEELANPLEGSIKVVVE